MTAVGLETVLRGCALAAILWSAASPANPYTPAGEDVVLERVAPAGDPAARELAVLRDRLRQQPENSELAARYAQAAIQRGRATADPRFYGYAAAALDAVPAWRDVARAPPGVLTLRATLLQQRHDFAGALALLDRALELEPAHGQARLTRAVLHQVQGRPKAAQRDCTALTGRSSETILLSCLASALSLQGRAADALRLLQRADAAAETAAARLWPLGLTAEIHYRLGEMEQAEQAFRRALEAMRSSGETDFYLLATRADFLLDAHRAAEVETLLASYPATDALLLRRALAASALRDPALSQSVARLSERFAAEATRGEDEVHLRERIWFELELNGAPAVALDLAARNWRTQREPLDARLLLQAAVVARAPKAAQPVLDWMQETGIEDRQLHDLRQRLAAP